MENEKLYSFVIPGLAMAAKEMPTSENTVLLENPETGEGVQLEYNYTIEDVAKIHLETINRHVAKNDVVHIYGMSFGGMVLSIISSIYAKDLPENTFFHFVATSPNLKSNPAVPLTLLKSWSSIKQDSRDDYKKMLSPFFSDKTCVNMSEVFEKYIDYRFNRKNRQTPRAFFRQLNCIFKYDGEKYFKNISHKKSTFYFPEDDYILDKSHQDDLCKLSPNSKKISITGCGHMVNLERPEYFDCKRGLDVQV